MNSAPDDHDLRQLVLSGDVEATLAACRATQTMADVHDRAKVFKTCAQILQGDTWSGEEFSHSQASAAAIVTTSVGTLAELRGLRWLPVPEEPVAVELLGRRDRPFRDAWAAQAFDDIHPDAIRVARRLIADGLAAKPTTDGYVIALIGIPGAFDLHVDTAPWSGRHASALDVVRRNPDLLDDLWRLFEVEGGGENSLGARDKFSRPDTTWSHALLTLATEGTLDRSRLLDASLAALDRGFAQFRAQWFSAFHEALAPTPGERSIRVGQYLSLSGSPIGPTVSMALKALTIVQKEGALDGARAVDGLGLALLTPAKGSSLKALKLIASAVRQDRDLLPTATERVTTALGHESLDVQLAVVNQLREWHRQPPAALVTDLERQRLGCHAIVRDHLGEWLGRTARNDGAVLPARVPYVMAAPRGVDSIDWLAADRTITPISDSDEFFEQASSALESQASADDIERVVTFLAEAGRSLATSSQAATLARRAEKLVSRSDRGSQVLLGELICAAFSGPITRPRSLSDNGPGRSNRQTNCIDRLLVERVRSLARQVSTGVHYTPVASPTHLGGLIDPVTLAHRLESVDREAGSAELRSAMLRLAPVPGRLAEAAEILQSTRHRRIRGHLQQWLETCETDSTAGRRWMPNSTASGTFTQYSLAIDDEGVITTHGMPEPVSLHSHHWGTLSGIFTQDPVGVGWVGSLVPALPEAWARVGIAAIGPTSYPKEVAHGDQALLDRYFDPTCPMGDSVHLLIALALNDSRRTMSAVAVDLIIASIGDRRLDADRLGQHMGALTGTGCVTPPRWARALRDVAGNGPLHDDAVVCVLERTVATAQPPAMSDMLALLELLESLLIEHRWHVGDPDARAALERLAGTSKTARTAARVLTLGSDRGTGSQQ